MSISKLGEFIEEYSKKNKTDEAYPVYSVTNRNGFCTEYFNKDVSGEDKTNYKIVPRGYFAYNPSRINVGSIDWQNYEDNVIVSPLYIVFKCSEKLNQDYLKYFLKSSEGKRLINTKVSGSVRNNLKFNELSQFEFNIVGLDEQRDVVAILKRIEAAIDNEKRQIELYDELIKARFVELFGDPLINSQGINTMPMTEVCEIIDGDRGKNYPTADEFFNEGYCLFLNAKNVTASGFNFDNCMFVSKEKDEALRKGKLSRGDVVLTTRGTLGNLAFYTDEIPFEHVRINSGMVILRMKKDVLDEVYFIEQFKMQLADIKEKIASGSAQPQLPISTMNKIQILIPEIELQKQFADFVKQVDKSKIESQKRLRLYEELLVKKMSDYFIC